MRQFLAALFLGFWIAPFILAADPAIGPNADHRELARRLEQSIEREMREKQLPAFSIALVDGDEIVYARGFGMADPEAGIPATAETVYRVGSVSKLFTDIAVMQLVERGDLDLDKPVVEYLPEFQPQNPFGAPVTLRQLMSHRSGLVREPPVGHYFDDAEPSLAETVASLNRTALVYPPETRTKYSNAAIAVVGCVLERRLGKPFAALMQENVLDRMALAGSGFELTPKLRSRLAKATMWTYDGRTFEAPSFGLGTSPAGNLYATVNDLGVFLSTLFRNGQGKNGRLLTPETLRMMTTPQFSESGERQGFGIGFHLSELDGHRQIGHGGAVYGFSTQLAALPEVKLGVAAVAAKDGTNGTVRRLAEFALRGLLAVRNEEPLPDYPVSAPVPAEVARNLDGRFRNGDEVIELVERNGRLFLKRGPFRRELRMLADALVIDDVFGYGPEVVRHSNDAVVIEGESFTRIPRTKPAPAPKRWLGLIGEYGWDHNTLFIYEDRGRLHALIEWFYDYPLTELSNDEFAFPDEYGLYHGEKLLFERDASGRATQVTAAEVLFRRRNVGPESGETFRIRPVRPVAELRPAALAARPPRESGPFLDPDLVELTSLDDSIRLDIRYAATNNFMGAVFYQQPRAFLQRPAAKALVRAHRKLKQRGYGLLIYDGYRPWYVTKMFWDATPEDLKIFVADPERGSRHNRGAAVDLTLYDLKTGEPIPMVAGYDEFSPRAFPDYPGGASLARWHRELLRDAMEAEGFAIYEFEWWHFDYQDWEKYPILNVPFEKLGT